MLAIVGHTALDIVDGSSPRPGGVPLYAARALRALGEHALIVTRCAEQDRELLRPLYALGLPVVWRAEEQTPVFHLRNRGDAREIEIGALGSPWTPDDAGGWVEAALGGVDWIHAGPLWRGDFPAETLHQLARGRRLSFDGQGLVRPGRVGPVERDADVDLSLLRHVDVLHLSGSEAEALGVALDERSLRLLDVPEIVVTLGSSGSVVYADDLAEHVPAQPVDMVDPTGSGDAFIAIYVASRRRGHEPASAARRATRLVHRLLTGRAETQ
jgi:sugar/nucleoside kinase (ribokinase family)